jgi:hypothetical protein
MTLFGLSFMTILLVEQTFQSELRVSCAEEFQKLEVDRFLFPSVRASKNLRTRLFRLHAAQTTKTTVMGVCVLFGGLISGRGLFLFPNGLAGMSTPSPTLARRLFLI